MSTQRDELAREIFLADNHNIRTIAAQEWAQNERPDRPEYVYGIADGLIAAGYRKPRTIETVEELDALAIDAVVMSETVAYQKYSGDHWAADGRFYQTGQVDLPATVLYEPAA